MGKTVLKIIAWITGSGFALAMTIYGGAKYIAWEQIKEDRAIKADTTMLSQLRDITKDIKTMKGNFEVTKSAVNSLAGSQVALEHSYVRTLEKTLKDKDELLQYKDEKIQALDEALKKNSFYNWIQSPGQDTLKLLLRKNEYTSCD